MKVILGNKTATLTSPSAATSRFNPSSSLLCKLTPFTEYIGTA